MGRLNLQLLCSAGILMLLVVVGALHFSSTNKIAGIARQNPKLSEPVPLTSVATEAVLTGLLPGPQPEMPTSFERLKERWKNPSWASARFDEAFLDIEKRYGRFFSETPSWSAEKRELLKQKLAANQLALMRASLPERGAQTPEESLRQRELIKETLATNEQSVRELLGEDDYMKLDTFEKRETYRDSVANIANSMRSKGVALSAEQEESLLSAYSTSIQEATSDSSNETITGLNESQLQELRLRQSRNFEAKLAKHAAGLIDENQLNLFLESEMEQGGGSG